MKDGQIIQLTVALAGGIVVYLFSFMGHSRWLFHFLVVSSPFQIVDSRYGTLNMALTYMLGVSALLDRKLKTPRRPELIRIWLALGLVAFAYALCFVWNMKPITFMKLIYLVGLGSNLVLMYLVTVFVTTEEDVHRFFKLIIICNGLVLGYCFLQVLAGFTQIIPFGIQEFAFIKNRNALGGEDRRLMGPFSGAGILAEYFVIMIFLLLYYRLFTKRYKRAIPLLVFLNMCAMVGTGNRGGFITMIIGFIAFVFTFKEQLNLKMVARVGVVGVILMTLASVIMYKYTDFNILYERLMNTEIDGGVPDTRAGWPEYIDEAMEKSPIFGIGIRIVAFMDATNERGEVTNPGLYKKARSYPHSLYIYLFYTMGFLGLVVYALMFGALLFSYVSIGRIRSGNAFLDKMHKLAILIMCLFAIDQFKIEFLRPQFSDYQHFLVIMLTTFLCVGAIKGKVRS